MLPNDKLVGLAAAAPGVTPSPVNGMFSVGFDPSEVMVTLPVALPPVVGANFTLKLTLCPALNVTGSASPLILNPLRKHLPR